MKQLALELPHWGGKRRGAGRKPKRRRPLVSHRSRPRFEKPAAVQVSLSVAAHVWNLRSRRCFEVIEACLAAARERFGLRVIESLIAAGERAESSTVMRRLNAERGKPREHRVGPARGDILVEDRDHGRRMRRRPCRCLHASWTSAA